MVFLLKFYGKIESDKTNEDKLDVVFIFYIFLFLFFFILLIFYWQIASTWFYMTGFAHIYKMDFTYHAINSYYNEMFCSLVIGL